MAIVGTPDPDPESDPNSDPDSYDFDGLIDASTAGGTSDGDAASHFIEDTPSGWLSEADLNAARGQLPLVYVEALPVRLNELGQITEVGLLLRVNDSDSMIRTIVSGRVRFGESVREALQRHLENDIGPTAFPQLPANLVPDAVAEYFPVPSSETDLFDGRQHAVSLVYIVPINGECQPRQDALELAWLSVPQVLSESVLGELEGNRGVLLKRLLAGVTG